jgi:hypothetical protein
MNTNTKLDLNSFSFPLGHYGRISVILAKRTSEGTLGPSRQKPRLKNQNCRFIAAVNKNCTIPTFYVDHLPRIPEAVAGL